MPSLPSTQTYPVQSTSAIDPQNIRLPTNVTPLNYKLYLEVDFQVLSTEDFFEAERFIGRVEIHIRLTEPSKKIIFHADRSLNIEDNIQITDLSTMNVINISSDNHQFLENQLYEIETNEVLQVGEYVIKIDYIGGFGKPTNIIGFYKTQYNEDGITKYKFLVIFKEAFFNLKVSTFLRYLLGTKFQPTDARKAL